MHTLSIHHTWDGAAARADEHVRVRVSEITGAMRVWVDAPFHGDPPPAAPSGPTWALWDHEVVELFVLGPDDHYAELELGPHGHHLLLRLEGRRNIVDKLLPVRFSASIADGRWVGEAEIPASVLPPRPWRVNSFAIHGVDRRYLTHTPLPGDKPDFHRLSLFAAVPGLGAGGPRLVADTLLAALEAAHDPERAAHARGYYPSALRFVGASVPVMRDLLRPIVSDARKWPAAEVHALVGLLWASGVHEGRQMAFDLLDQLHAARRALAPEEVAALAEGNDNWGSVDAYACGVSGRAWNEGRMPDAQVHQWAGSDNRWLRRTALVTTVPLNTPSRGGKGDPARTLDICHRLVGDRDDMVVKALSWALRSLIQHDAAAVERFVTTHDVAPRVRREVGTKLRTGRKAG
jgi:3-methyladenine DNA glycosylase AlkD